MRHDTGEVALTIASRRALEQIDARHAEHLGAVSAAHGFMLRRPLSLHLPDTHRAWDEAASGLPQLWRTMSARPVLRRLPLLSAEPDVLPDADLWRASVVLSALAYSYARCDVDDLHAQPPIEVPDCIAVPWRRVSDRMARPGPHVAYDDLITHNYRLIDPAADDPVRLENLRLLVPLLGNETERAFFGVNIEIQAALGPVVEASVRAQEAVVAQDRDGVVRNLLIVLDAVRRATDVAFPKIDPNPHAAISADPVVWAKLTAPTGISVVAGAPGISGAGSTGFQLVDTLLGRTRFDSSLGEEARKIRGWFAPNCRLFLDAIEEVSLRSYIEGSGDRELAGLFQSVLEAYAGDRGYLGVHRRKVYGFIETAFKVGRPSTASGITGTLRDKTWMETDEHLAEAREERYEEFFSDAQIARLARREPAAGDLIQEITFDVTDTGMVFRPGDRCAVLPEQTDTLVRQTLASLRSPGDLLVPLTRAWRAALRTRFGTEPPRKLPLAEFLRHAHLRPLDRRVAKRLARLSGSPALTRIIDQRDEDRFELWEAFELAAAANYDVNRLARAELWQDESLARIVPPLASRMYSVSRPPDASPFATELKLTVGHLRFTSPDVTGKPASRRGTASTFLAESAEPGSAVNLQIVRPLRFTIPDDRQRPIVMFAGGTGIAPFQGFVQARTAAPGAGTTWLFVAARTRAELPYYDALAALAADGRIRLDTAFSRETVDETPARRIGDAIVEPRTAAALRELLRAHDAPDGGPLFYVCGQAAFAATVLDAVKRVVADGGEDGSIALRRLTGRGRLMTDLFTTFAPRTDPGVAGSGTYDASELVLRNDEEHGWWMAINGAVYDVTEFRQLHPGGFRIIDDNAGVDATAEYEAVRHHQDSEIEAMLAMYKIGFLRRLDLGRAWGIALHGGRTRYVPLSDVFRSWMRHLYLVVELQNSLRNDTSVLDAVLTAGEDGASLTPLKLMLASDLQSRMLALYLPAVAGEGLHELWALACGLFDAEADARELPTTLRELATDARGVRASAGVAALRDAARDEQVDAAAAAPMVGALRAANAELMAAVKQSMRAGLIVFEIHEARVAERGANELMTCLRTIPEAVAAYHERVATAVEDHMSGLIQREGDSNGRAVAALRRAGSEGARPRR